MNMRNETERLRRLVVQSLSVLVILLLSFGYTSGEVLIEVPDPGPSHTPGSGVYDWSIVAQPFTLATPAKDVQIQLGLNAYSSSAPLDVYLSSRVGPGTTLNDVVATRTINVGGRGFYNALNVPVLPAGEWFLTLYGPMNLTVGWLHPNVPVTVTGQIGNHRYINYRTPQNANKAFPPASIFQIADASSNRKHLMRVIGDVVNLDITEPVGPGTVVQIDAGDPTGNGVSTDGKRTFHKLSAQSVAGSTPESDTGSMERIFMFERDDGVDEPIVATVFGDLHGRLIADNLGLASVDATLVLKDAAGNVLGDDSRNFVSNPALGFQEEITVNERLEIVANLVPGELYSITSSLTVNASSPLGGAGRAFFDETYTVDLKGVPIPEPAALPIMFAVFALLGRVGRSRG